VNAILRCASANREGFDLANRGRTRRTFWAPSPRSLQSHFVPPVCGQQCDLPILLMPFRKGPRCGMACSGRPIFETRATPSVSAPSNIRALCRILSRRDHGGPLESSRRRHPWALKATKDRIGIHCTGKCRWENPANELLESAKEMELGLLRQMSLARRGNRRFFSAGHVPVLDCLPQPRAGPRG